MKAHQAILAGIMSTDSGESWERMARNVARSLATEGFAVIHKPAPDEVIGADDHPSTHVWGDLDSFDDTVTVSAGSGRVRVSVPDARHDVEEARGLAAKILAGCDVAEGGGAS